MMHLCSTMLVMTPLASVLAAASSDDRLADISKPFAKDICRHFAMLFAAGTKQPPPAPYMFRPPMEKEEPVPIPPGLFELDVHLFLTALLEVLCDKVSSRAKAALDGLQVFVETVMHLHQAKKTALKAVPQQGGETGEGAAPAAEGATPMDSQPSSSKAGDKPVSLLSDNQITPFHCVALLWQLRSMCSGSRWYLI